jgi:murein DD-endopeptidase MepM/ murein hydrolase activator NlpD
MVAWGRTVVAMKSDKLRVHRKGAKAGTVRPGAKLGFLVTTVATLSILAAAGSTAQVDASPASQPSALFLSPPYYGTSEVTSVFDHELPLWGANDGNSWTMHFDGVRGGAGARSSYDQHRGIDYWLRYEPIRAAAPGTIARADWANPADHRASYGLHVRIDHTEGFRTIYGHMSVLRVQQGDEIPASVDEFGRIIGLSGNTGLCYGWEGTGPSGRCTDNDPPSCGAHIHFQLEHDGIAENPYGWVGPFADPWSLRPDGATSVDRWEQHPSITNSDVFPSDEPLSSPSLPLDEEGQFTVDDGNADFSEEPAGCWTVDSTTGWNGSYRHRDVPGADCTATWSFPQDQPAGRYHVFVHVPNDDVALSARNATVDAAQYTIHHATASGSQNKQTDIAIVNQWAYPNSYHASRWVYVGTYTFDSNESGTDYVRLDSQTVDAAGTLAADAVRFVPQVYPYHVHLPIVLRRWPPVPDTPVLNPIESTDPDSYLVSWDTTYLAETYTLQEGTDLDFTSVVTRYLGTDTSWTAVDQPPGTYHYRVKATNAWGDSGWSNVQSSTVISPGWQIITSQDFEGDFPGSWVVYDDNGADYGEYEWSQRNCRPYAGSYSGWGVGGGDQGTSLSCGSDYPHDTDSWMVYGPFDLTEVITGELRFKLWLDTEPQNDTLFYGASVDGAYFSGLVVSGDTQGWMDISLDLSDIPILGNLLGQPQVWVALAFSSDSATARAEGSYVDDIALRECLREPCTDESGDAEILIHKVPGEPTKRWLRHPVKRWSQNRPAR